MGQEVAIKLLRDADPNERTRFTREAAYLQKLRHPNIVRIFDAGEYAGQPYIVMQLVKGRHVDALVAQGRQLEQRRAAEITVQGLEALVAAHRQGILHRDIKPGNFIIGDDGVVRLLDFGLAQLMVLESGLTASGAVVGTPAYMSPEQARGDRELVGPRSDLYGMGACLYELVTGHPPFEADNPVAVLHRVVNSSLTPPRQWRPDLDRDLETIVLRAMARSPQDRYPSAEAMAEDLRRFLRGERVKAKRPGAFTGMMRSAWQERRSVATLGLGVFISLALVVLLVDIAVNQRPAPSTTATSSTGISATGSGTTLQANATWITAWEHEKPLQGGLPEVVLRPFPDKDRHRGMVYTPNLPAITGPVRLRAKAILGEGTSRVELLICDSDVGAGYRLRLEAVDKGGRLSLLRERRVIVETKLAKMPRNVPLSLSIERQDFDDTILVMCDGAEPLTFLDLQPIEDMQGNAVYVAFTPQTTVHDVVLERRRSQKSGSPLADADSQRLAKRWARAKSLYESFLTDNPDSPQAREAELRMAMCDRLLENHDLALERCADLISRNRNDKRFVQLATFQVWLCALSLKRFQEAGEQLAVLQRDYTLEYLLSLAPSELIRAMLEDHLERGEKLARQDMRLQAIDCFDLAERLATTLRRNKELRHARHWKGDLLRSLDGRCSDALQVFTQMANDAGETPAERGWAQLKCAETLRLRNEPGDTREAIAIYRTIAKQSKELPAELCQTARLWLGDLLVDMNSADAYAIWGQSTESRSISGAIMDNLSHARMPSLPTDPTAHDHLINYFRARYSQLNDLDEPQTRKYLEQLRDSLERCTAWSWPAPLARQWLQHLDPP
jgi:tetratricopeptide (TPR) repeat protein